MMDPCVSGWEACANVPPESLGAMAQLVCLDTHYTKGFAVLAVLNAGPFGISCIGKPAMHVGTGSNNVQSGPC